ncbi:MAG TPA: hypothetical protein PKE26_10545 [Kiritimatiellia bacterium]|nr:hypothetical protein [Kiritimatiellia bacterium]HMO99536.1 hypothetical protein [Kiritimatiellia bacterium]
MKRQPTLVYYITAHGYGHGVRSCDILRALRQRHPELAVRVVSDLPVDFLRSRLDLPLEAYRAGSFDVGMVQRDSIRVDVAATWEAVRQWLGRRRALVEQERVFLREARAGAVVCDIPSLPLEAAKAEGLPALAVGNFSWDWIYEEFLADDAGWREPINAFQHGYRQADLLLRLPFSEPMQVFPRRVDLPLVATHGSNRRAEMAAAYHLDAGKTWVLLSFTTLDWDEAALQAVAGLRDYVFLTVKPLAWDAVNICPVDRHRFSFSDVIASADLVVSKPGYGILSECAVNEKPLIYAERTHFREYPILEAALKEHLRAVHIPAEELYRGHLAPFLEAGAVAAPPRVALETGGDVRAADLLAGFVTGCVPG